MATPNRAACASEKYSKRMDRPSCLVVPAASLNRRPRQCQRIGGPQETLRLGGKEHRALIRFHCAVQRLPHLRRHPSLSAKCMFRRRHISAQADLFSTQGDLFSWAGETQRQLWRNASWPQRLGEPTPLTRLGELFLKVGHQRGDPTIEAKALRLLGWKLH